MGKVYRRRFNRGFNFPERHLSVRILGKTTTCVQFRVLSIAGEQYAGCPLWLAGSISGLAAERLSGYCVRR